MKLKPGNPQRRTYLYKNGLAVKTKIPSLICSKLLHLIPQGSRVLDIACGANGRNSAFFAYMGFKVDCFDMVDLDFLDDIDEDLAKNINFSVSNLENYDYKKDYYHAAIMIRLLHLLRRDEIDFMFRSLSYSLVPGGYLALVYTYKGGMLDLDEIPVEKYSYRIDVITRMLEKYGFEIVYKNKYVGNSTYVSYTIPVQTYDIIARKK